MQIVPIDTKIDFLGARKKAFFLSGVMVTGSLLCVALLGLNQGIDFKGGSSAIVDFKKGALTDRSQLETSIAALIRRELNDDTTQVTVQDFSSGVQNTGADGTSIDRFIIYTEAPSLISAAKKLVIKAALEKEYAKGNKKPQVRYNEEGSDTYYLTLPEEADIKDTVASLKTLFTSGCAADGKPLKTPEALCYPVITVKSDEEQRLEVSNVKELNLLNQESQGKDLERMKQIKKKQLQEMAEKLDKKPDSRFTINIEELRVKIGDTLRADFGDKFVEVTSSTSVSPSVGKTLLYDGILAIFYAIIGILIYIVLRFDVRFAPGAVIALLHDVIITVGLFSLFQVKFSLPIIAALLTIVGYSLNDTIVVLDRVRETFNDLRGKNIIQLLNRAINSTLSRTVGTSITTLLVVLAILFLGGGLIRDFALALAIGIVVGTYSSIFVASPFVYYMDLYLKRREELAKGKGRSDGSASPKPAKA